MSSKLILNAMLLLEPTYWIAIGSHCERSPSAGLFLSGGWIISTYANLSSYCRPMTEYRRLNGLWSNWPAQVHPGNIDEDGLALSRRQEVLQQLCQEGKLERIPVRFEHSRHGERNFCIFAR